MTLWWILGLATVGGLFNALYLAVNPNASKATSAAIRLVGFKAGPAACVVAICALLNAVLWITYSFEVQDWRFAAIWWIPAILAYVGRLVGDSKHRQAVVRRE